MGVSTMQSFTSPSTGFGTPQAPPSAFSSPYATSTGQNLGGGMLGTPGSGGAAFSGFSNISGGGFAGFGANATDNAFAGIAREGGNAFGTNKFGGNSSVPFGAPATTGFGGDFSGGLSGGNPLPAANPSLGDAFRRMRG